MSLISIDPYTLKVIKRYKTDSKKQLAEKLRLASEAQKNWKLKRLDQRIKVLLQVKKKFVAKRHELAACITSEMGKTINESYHEVDKCIGLFDYYAAAAPRLLKDKIAEKSTQDSIVSYQPLGCILAVMPWNFPVWQVIRNIIPIVLSGNAYVLKHASNVYGCAELLVSIFKSSKQLTDLVQLLYISASEVNAVIESPSISAVTLTGSVAAGKAVATKAASVLKKSVLELGGNDAYVVLDDADIDLAVEVLLKSRILNTGQSCVCAKRFIVTQRNKKQFEEKLLHRLKHLNAGDPMLAETTIGPLAKPEINAELNRYVEQSIKMGATCIYTSALPKQGNFYPITVLTNVTAAMPAFQEELFGPVCVIIAAKNNNEAILLANQSKFGLGGGIISANTKKAKELAIKHFESGMVAVNNFVRSTYDMPFGGIKQSGFGRELAEWGLLEFVNIKYISVAK